MKTVAINAVPLLSPLSGVGRYTYEICKRINGQDYGIDFSFFYGYMSKNVLEPTVSGISLNAPSVFSRVFRRVAKKAVTAFAALSPKRYDLYWEPNNILENYFKARSVLFTLHDISVLRCPQWHPAQRVELFRQRIESSLKRADLIITDSHFSKTEIIDYFNLEPDMVRAIHLGYDTELFHEADDKEIVRHLKMKYTHGHDFILFSGSLEPRKNLNSLITAYLSLPHDIRQHFKLLLVGGQGWNNTEIMKLIYDNADVIHAGYVGYDELASLYRAATLFAFPSHYEGFGLPPLEAMACGCPVLVSPNASLPEVCGDAAYYVEAENTDSIREGMLKILSDTTYAAGLSQSGLIQCRKFCWDTTAAEHIKCMHELL